VDLVAENGDVIKSFINVAMTKNVNVITGIVARGEDQDYRAITA
jgi:hypothetical protein